jgi:hypothetical protein
VLSDHLFRCQQLGMDPSDLWFTITIDRFKQAGRRYYWSLAVRGLLATLKRLVFSDIDLRIQDVASMFDILFSDS